MAQQVSKLYDYLAMFESFFSGFNPKKKTYSIHKKLHFNRFEKTKHLSDINDWILENLPLNKSGKILDAGCGVGNTLLTFCQKTNMTGLGISLSQKEIQKAKQASLQLNLSDRCLFEQKSFDTPFDTKYNTIIAIESLKHAPDLPKALNNLANALTSDGILVVLEDFGVENWVESPQLRQDFLNAWGVQSFYTIKNYTDVLFSKMGKTKSRVYDFTPYMEAKPTAKMYQRFQRMNSLKAWVVFPVFKSILSTFAGGFLLDYFYGKQQVKYQLLIVQKVE